MILFMYWSSYKWNSIKFFFFFNIQSVKTDYKENIVFSSCECNILIKIMKKNM